MEYLLWPIAPIVFGVVVGLVAFIVRHYIFRRPRTVNYFTIFMDAAASYVFLVMIWNHKWNGESYASMLDRGFGVDEVTIAFLFASYHFISEILHRVWRPT